VKLHGQVPAAQQPAVRRHIIRNAQRIGASAMAVIPDHWNTDGTTSDPAS